MNKQKLVGELLAQLEALPHRDSKALDALLKRSEMYIRNIFGESSKYLNDLKRVHFFPQVYPSDEAYYNERWNSGANELKNLFQTMSEELALFDNASAEVASESTGTPLQSSQKIRGKAFVVHGHNDGVKNEVARFLEKLSVEAIILHERANSGKTLIEKFEHESADVNFAVVLLTADDEGRAKESSSEYASRARQNVIFELGYFIGILGRSKVVALREKEVEIPSDYSGVVYIDLTNTETWKLQLAKEIKNSGIDIDLNSAL
jgi:predicted nucleotide-binding protein